MTEQELFAQLPSRLIAWFSSNARELPWRRDREPYHVWLSEIMLQQTRVEAVKQYYTRFLQELPTIRDLAEADDTLLMKLWEGLGYYTRVRNLKRAACEIQEKYGGKFPTSHAEILSLPGIGAYTAGAIASICFEQPTPAVDGNVLRVITRVLADGRPITRPEIKKSITQSLQAVYPAGQCGAFTQSLMELGALVCLPNGAPQCGNCPLQTICRACQQGQMQNYPVKEPKKPRRQEEKTVFLLECSGCYAVCKRREQGLLAGLWEYPNVEGTLTPEQAVRQVEDWGAHPQAMRKQVHRSHIFTHVQWNMTAYCLQCAVKSEKFTWATVKQLDQTIALPTAFRMFRADAET